MFTAGRRAEVRASCIERARTDSRVVSAASVGSFAAGREDAFSDIDLALRLSPDSAGPVEVIRAWSDWIYAAHQAVAHTDLWSDGTLYRVFLLEDSLQVDLSLSPYAKFGQQGGGAFELIFGEAVERDTPAQSDGWEDSDIGMTWLYALHARSSLARGRNLQAVHMLNGIREQIITLLCRSAGLPAYEGRGVDDLPEPVKLRVSNTLIRSTATEGLVQTFRLLIELALDELERRAPTPATDLRPVLLELVRTASPS